MAPWIRIAALVLAAQPACFAEPTCRTETGGGCAKPQPETLLLQTHSVRLAVLAGDASNALNANASAVSNNNSQAATVKIPITSLEETPVENLSRVSREFGVAGVAFLSRGAAVPTSSILAVRRRVESVGHSFYKGDGDVESDSPWIAFAVGFVVLLLMPLSLYAACAQIYLLMRPVPERELSKSVEENFQEWRYPLYGCMDEPGICLCAFFCPAVRWSETVSFFPALLAFWSAFFIFVFLTSICPFFYPKMWALTYFLLVFLFTCSRQLMRKEFKMESQGALSSVADFATYFFCWPCAIAQEARHAEEALRCGHEAVRRPENRPAGFPAQPSAAQGAAS